MQFLLLCSQLPATPSRARVMVWRRMRAAGATSTQNGVWVLPHSDAHEKFLMDVQGYVEQQGGTGQIFVATTLNPYTEARILESFRADRDAEYGEFVEQCEDFLGEIAKEIRRRNFSYAEFEENEQNLNKLVDWLAKIKARDFTTPSRAAEADTMLDKCRQGLLEFADQVYGNERIEDNPDTADDREVRPPREWIEGSPNGTQEKEK